MKSAIKRGPIEQIMRLEAGHDDPVILGGAGDPNKARAPVDAVAERI